MSVHTLFITASAPMSTTEEAFVQDELEELLHQGASFTVAPMRRHTDRPNPRAVESGLATCTIGEPLLSFRILLGAARALVGAPVAVCSTAWVLLRHSGGRKNLLNNIASFPKALWLSQVARRAGAQHVHAYWLAHTSTAAWVVHRINGIPWSGTGYRWDIDAENLFAVKLPSAAFIRCADELGESRLRAALDRHGAQVQLVLIRTGVRIPPAPDWDHTPVAPTTIGCIGAFVEKKAQDLLVRSFAPVHERHPTAHLHLFGSGSREPLIRAEVERLGLSDAVTFHGTVPLEDLRRFLERRPITVLPSIITEDLQQEGIPVTLVEAMAHASPVVSTTTGSIPNLVVDGTGCLLAPGDEAALTVALLAIIDDPAQADQWSKEGYQRVREEFDLASTSGALLRAISEPAR